MASFNHAEAQTSPIHHSSETGAAAAVQQAASATGSSLPHPSSAISSVSPVPLPVEMDRSPPLTPTPTPSSSFTTAQGNSAGAPLTGPASRIRAISPPTPAPSPQPHSRVQTPSLGALYTAAEEAAVPVTGWRAKAPASSPFFDPSQTAPPTPLSEADLLIHLRSQINALAPSSRSALLSQLIHDSAAVDLSPLLALITPRLKRDFLRTLPLELAFHVLGFVDDVKTLARASGVSRFWRALLEDEATWKHMCWKSGFAAPSFPFSTSVSYEEDAAALLSPTPATPFFAGPGGTTGERLRSLEFGTRPAEEDDHLYTPAGRERRGTLDRNALSEFAARAELFDLPPATLAAARAGTGGTGLGLAGSAIDHSGSAGQRGIGLPTGGLAQRRGLQQVPPVMVPTTPGPQRTQHGGALDVSDLRQSLVASQAPSATAPFPVASTSSALPLPARPAHQAQLVSPPMFAVPTPHQPASSPVMTTARSLQPLQTARHQPLPHPHLSPVAYRSPAAIATSTTSNIPSFPPPPPRPSSRPSAPQPFSYKKHFKTAYLTQDAWLHGPGRLLSTQMSADDGVVTSMGFDDEWIVVGMATSKVHVFEAGSGGYVRTLEGHDLGVWCLTLVSKGGGPRERIRTREASGEGAGEEDGKEWWEDWKMEGEAKQGKGKGKTREREASSASSTSVHSTEATSARASAANLNVPPPSATTDFFRDGATTPLAASFHSSPSSPSRVPLDPNTASSSASASTSHAAPRRRRSFPSTSSSASSPPPPPPESAPSFVGQEEGGGMGIGAGGPTGDRGMQAGVCGTARGWGQKGAVVVSGGCDRDVRVWEVETGRCLHILQGHTSTVRCMRVLDSRPIAVSGSRDKTLRVWDLEKGTCLHVLNGHSMSVRCIEVHGNKVVSGSYDATCRLWDVDTGECLQVFRGHIHQIYAVAFDGIKVITGSLDSTVRVWSAETGEFLALLQGHTSLVGQLQLDPVTNHLVTGGSDGRVLVFSLDDYEIKHALQAHENSVTCLQFDSRFLISASNDGRIKLWDFRTGHFIRDLADPCDAVWRVVLRDDKCVTLCRRGERTLMDVKTFVPSEEELANGVGGRRV
ncbi:hypothetical protein JCM11641_000763 [Rhodosporidiobolus odoratus]